MLKHSHFFLYCFHYLTITQYISSSLFLCTNLTACSAMENWMFFFPLNDPNSFQTCSGLSASFCISGTAIINEILYIKVVKSHSALFPLQTFLQPLLFITAPLSALRTSAHMVTVGTSQNYRKSFVFISHLCLTLLLTLTS